VLQCVGSLLLSPFQMVGQVLSSRAVRSFTFRATRSGRFRPKYNYSLPVMEHSQLSALYFAIEQATLDDEVC
jgi:hypothetical protein